jgi:uncharacterized protein (DUF1015 family)
MSVIRPLRGLRPRPDRAAEVASPPYDVLSSEEAREQVRGHPDSFLRVNKPEVDFGPETNAYSPEVYRKGHENLRRLMSEGIMVRDESPCVYPYRLTWRGRSQTGLVCLTSSIEYEGGLIRKHEHVRPDKVADRTDHMEGVGAQVGPVFSILRDDPEVLSLLDAVTAGTPAFDFVVPGMEVRHELWVVSDPEQVDRFVAAFARQPALYIADGHHRSAAAAEYSRRAAARNPDHRGDEPYNFFLNVVFPAGQLRILPYNRVVSDLGGRSPADFLAELAKVMTVEPSAEPVSPAERYEYGLFLDGKWYRTRAKAGVFDADHPAKSIDSAVLTDIVLGPILGIEDIRTDRRIDFVGGIRGTGELERLVSSGRYAVAFSLFPVTVDQLLTVADAGEVMPPKSTWFEPKLRSGLVVNLLTE